MFSCILNVKSRFLLLNLLRNQKFALSALFLSFNLLILSGIAEAAETRRVIVLETLSLPYLQNSTMWFRKELGRLGYIDGSTVSYTVLNAEGDAGRAGKLLTDAMSEQKVDLVVTVATLASRAAHKILEESKTPQLFMIVADPVGEGLVSEIGKKSQFNLTGRTHVVPALAKLSFVAKSVANIASTDNPLKIGLLHSSYPASMSDSRQLVAHGEQFPEIEFHKLAFDFISGDSGRAEMREAASNLIKVAASELDGLWLTVGPNELDILFVRSIVETGVPLLYAGSQEAVKAGAMLSLVSSAEINGRAVARLADVIFKGTPASDIPITRPDTFSISLNVSTAKQLNAAIPSQIVELSGKNIFQ